MRNKSRELEQAERERVREIEREKDSEKDRDRDREKIELEQATSSITFAEFYQSYNAVYESLGFFSKNHFSHMHMGLKTGDISTIEQVKEYINKGQDSRSRTVFDELVASKINHKRF